MALMNGVKLYRAKGEVIELWSVTTAARELGTTQGVLKYWMKESVVPKPKKRVGKRRYYTSADLKELKALIGKYVKRKAELTSKAGLARLLGIAAVSLDWHIKTGSISPPEVCIGRVRFYSAKQVQEIKVFWTKRQNLEARLWHLENGMLELGCSQNDFQWLKTPTGRKYVTIPEPAVVHGNSNRNKYWTMEQLRKLYKEVKAIRG